MSPSTAALIAFFSLIFIIAHHEVDAECCHCRGTRCGDGTECTPYCGYRPCNWFGCDCGGGCRGRKKRQATSILNDADVNGDGVISTEEALSYLVTGGIIPEYLNASVPTFKGANGNTPHWFASMDSDGDGFISLGELDSDSQSGRTFLG